MDSADNPTTDQHVLMLELLKRVQQLEENYQKLQSTNGDTSLKVYLKAISGFFTVVEVLQPHLHDDGKHKTTKGRRTSVQGRVYPDALAKWVEFPNLHQEYFAKLCSVLGDDSLFPSRASVKAEIYRHKNKPLACETDMERFFDYAIVAPVEHTINKYLERTSQSTRKIIFKKEIVRDFETSNVPSTMPSSSGSTSAWSHRRIQPDGVWVSNFPQSDARNLLVVELKAAHILTMADVVSALGNKTFDKSFFSDAAALALDTSGSSKLASLKLNLASALTQIFHYMVVLGLEYGVLSTGVGFLFLHVDSLPKKPVLQYHVLDPLSTVPIESAPSIESANAAPAPVPATNTDTDTDIDTDIDTDADFRAALCTPACMMTTMAMMSLESTKLSDDRIAEVVRNCPVWLKKQPKLKREMSAANLEEHATSGSVGGLVPHSAIREVPLTAYCTQKCLIGLKRGSIFDDQCPNVSHHRSAAPGSTSHQITPETLSLLLQSQFSKNIDLGCQELGSQGKAGATGYMYKMTLFPHGYTIVAKGVPVCLEHCVYHEQKVYQRLEDAQGDAVPVCLGVLETLRPYWQFMGEGIYRYCEGISTYLLMSYAGEAREDADLEVVQPIIEMMEGLGVYHNDVRWPNVMFDKESGKPMVIDLDRAEIDDHEASFASSSTEENNLSGSIDDS